MKIADRIAVTRTWSPAVWPVPVLSRIVPVLSRFRLNQRNSASARRTDMNDHSLQSLEQDEENAPIFKAVECTTTTLDAFELFELRFGT